MNKKKLLLITICWTQCTVPSDSNLSTKSHQSEAEHHSASSSFVNFANIFSTTPKHEISATQDQQEANNLTTNTSRQASGDNNNEQTHNSNPINNIPRLALSAHQSGNNSQSTSNGSMRNRNNNSDSNKSSRSPDPRPPINNRQPTNTPISNYSKSSTNSQESLQNNNSGRGHHTAQINEDEWDDTGSSSDEQENVMDHQQAASVSFARLQEQEQNNVHTAAQFSQQQILLLESNMKPSSHANPKQQRPNARSNDNDDDNERSSTQRGTSWQVTATYYANKWWLGCYNPKKSNQNSTSIHPNFDEVDDSDDSDNEEIGARIRRKAKETAESFFYSALQIILEKNQNQTLELFLKHKEKQQKEDFFQSGLQAALLPENQVYLATFIAIMKSCNMEKSMSIEQENQVKKALQQNMLRSIDAIGTLSGKGAGVLETVDQSFNHAVSVVTNSTVEDKDSFEKSSPAHNTFIATVQEKFNNQQKSHFAAEKAKRDSVAKRLWADYTKEFYELQKQESSAKEEAFALQRKRIIQEKTFEEPRLELANEEHNARQDLHSDRDSFYRQNQKAFTIWNQAIAKYAECHKHCDQSFEHIVKKKHEDFMAVQQKMARQDQKAQQKQ